MMIVKRRGNLKPPHPFIGAAVEKLGLLRHYRLRKAVAYLGGSFIYLLRLQLSADDLFNVVH